MKKVGHGKIKKGFQEALITLRRRFNEGGPYLGLEKLWKPDKVPQEAKKKRSLPKLVRSFQSVACALFVTILFVSPGETTHAKKRYEINARFFRPRVT